MLSEGAAAGMGLQLKLWKPLLLLLAVLVGEISADELQPRRRANTAFQ